MIYGYMIRVQKPPEANLTQSIRISSVSLYNDLSWYISKALRYGPLTSFTCHPHTNHTYLYFPASRRHRLLAGTRCTYPRRDGQTELTWLAGYIGKIKEVNTTTKTRLSFSRNQTTRKQATQR